MPLKVNLYFRILREATTNVLQTFLKMRFLQILFFLIPYSLAFGQVKKESTWKPYVVSDIKRLHLVSFDSMYYPKAYRIWNSHQVVELIKINDSIYTGQLVNFVAKITRKEKMIGTISQKLKIPGYTVKLLIEKLSAENIETLPDSYDVKDYVNGLDGTTILFEICNRNSSRLYSYWEPENDYYQKPEIPEVKNVRDILKTIKNEIALEKLFSKFTDDLGPGTYDLGGIIMEKR